MSDRKKDICKRFELGYCRFGDRSSDSHEKQSGDNHNIITREEKEVLHHSESTIQGEDEESISLKRTQNEDFIRGKITYLKNKNNKILQKLSKCNCDSTKDIITSMAGLGLKRIDQITFLEHQNYKFQQMLMECNCLNHECECDECVLYF